MHKQFGQSSNLLMDNRTSCQDSVAARPDRRLAILLAAERLFAQHGYQGVSIRQIAEAAGVPPALVGYYFGAKHELFLAIFDHWRGTLEERLRLLAEARAQPPDGHTLRRVVQAFVEPVLKLRGSSEGECYAQLVARELAYRTPEAARVLSDHFDPLAHAFIDALHGASPGSTRAQSAWAYQFALGALIHHISDDRVERLSRGLNRSADPAAAQALVNFICAGIAAVVTPTQGLPPHQPSPAPKLTRRSPSAEQTRAPLTTQP
jgi:AcrR family transcriptional regulator